MSIFKQPLIHFLLLGALVFVIYQWGTKEFGLPDDEGKIVSRDSFIEFIQYRNRGLDRASAERLLFNMGETQKKMFLGQHIKEEVLYREAVKLGLKDKDYVIKQRLIQKMEYLLGDSDLTEKSVTSKAVGEYFSRNKQRYFIPSTVTFAQVFVDGSRHSKDEAEQLIQSLKDKLNRDNVPFQNASRYGERFAYFTNYVERNEDFIASHFGQVFAKTVFSIGSTTGQWQGPVASDYGFHLVFVAKLQPGGVPELSAIYNNVAQDLTQGLASKQLENNIQRLVDTYNINELELEAEF